KARVRTSTRKKTEARVPVRPVSEPADLTWREARQVLHQELTGLAESYRVPLVLCYLEGRTQDQAASELGLAKSTLKERRGRGGARRGARLVRRGWGPGGVLLAGAGPAAAAACPPVTLVSTTAKAATLFAAGQVAASGVISLEVAT